MRCYVCLEDVDDCVVCRVCHEPCCRPCLLELISRHADVNTSLKCGVCRQSLTPPPRVAIVHGPASCVGLSVSMLSTVMVLQLFEYIIIYKKLYRRLCDLRRRRTLLRATASNIDQRRANFETEFEVFARCAENYGVPMDGHEFDVRIAEISDFFARDDVLSQYILNGPVRQIRLSF